MHRISIALGLSLLVFAGCKETPKAELKPQPPKTTASGLTIQVLREGSGDPAQLKDKVTVHYVGTLQKDGSQFDSSRDREPFMFWLGENMVIPGWEEGVLGMKEGELRKLTIPPDLGYGNDAKPGIPKNSTLVFEIELVDIR